MEMAVLPGLIHLVSQIVFSKNGHGSNSSSAYSPETYQANFSPSDSRGVLWQL